MRHKHFSFATLLVLVSLILAACGGGTTGDTTGGAATQAPAAATQAPAAATEAPAAATTAATEAPAAATEAPAAATTAATEATAAPAASGDAITEDLGVELRSDLAGATIRAVLGSQTDAASKDWEAARARDFEELTGIKVELIAGAESATDRLANYLQQWGAQSSDVDVYMIDVIWPGIAAEHALDLAPTITDIDQFLPAIAENNTVDGKLVGVPFYTDAGLLYYRTDLLEKYNLQPPTTWEELQTAAQTIQEGERAGNADFWGYVWQGNAYEGLTCNALEWQVSNGGGQIVEPDGTITVNNPQVIEALDRAKGWIGTISPPGSTTYQEEDARGVWQAGNAAFMRNWPYAYALGQAADSPIKDKIGVAPLPQGSGEGARNAATLGGWQLMVSNYSQNQEAAAEFVKYLTSPAVMRSHAIELSRLPTRVALYDDAQVLEAQPFFGELKDVFTGGAVARPSTVTADLYNDVSIAYFTAVHSVLTGSAPAAQAMETLQAELERTLR